MAHKLGDASTPTPVTCCCLAVRSTPCTAAKRKGISPQNWSGRYWLSP